MTLLAIGTVAFDSIDTPFDTRSRILGGSATYFSYAASFFVPVRLVGMVGKDWPDRYSQLLADRGIDLTGLIQHPTNDTYFWHGRYSQDLQDRETLVWNVNGFDQFKPVVPAAFRDSRIVYLGAAAPSVQLETLEQCPESQLVVADTVDAWIETARDDLDRLLARIDCLLINDSEARQYTGVQNLVKAGKALQAQGPRTVIIKKGEHGCLFFHNDLVAPCPAFPSESVIDPTGAGDSFAGGLVGHLASLPSIDESGWMDAIHTGTVVASFTVSGFSIEGLQRIDLNEIYNRRRIFRTMLGLHRPQ
jgi:sugar/nucleoside kinase (ribokinase family)